jgi:O-antigen/teichoic acid export membrane protein
VPETRGAGPAGGISRAFRAPVKDYALSLVGRFGSAGANVVSILILVRALSPEAVGVFSLAVSTIAVLATVADAGLRTGFLRRTARLSTSAAGHDVVGAPQGALLGGIIAFEHLVGLALGGILLLAHRPFAGAFFGGRAGLSLIALIASGVLAHNAFHVATAPSQARQDFRAFFSYHIAWAATRLLGVAALAAAGVRDPIAYLVVHVGSLALSAAGVLVLEPGTSLRTVFGAWSRRALREPLVELRSVHWVATGSLLFMLMSQLGLFALGHWSTLAEVGRFAAVQRLVQVFQVATSALWTFLLPKVLGYDVRALTEFAQRLRAQLPSAVLLVLAAAGLVALALPLLLPSRLGGLRAVLFLLSMAALAEAYSSLLSTIFLNLGAYTVVVYMAAAKLAVGTLLASAWALPLGATGVAGACFLAEGFGLVGLAIFARAHLARHAAGEKDLPGRGVEGSP